MEAVYSWVKNIICCLCVLEMLYHIVQNPEYQRYLRFFGGIIFMLLTVGPLLDFFDLQSSFEKALGFSMRQEEAWNLQEAADSLFELQNEKIKEAYRNELKRQIEEIVKGYGRDPVKVSISLEEEEGIQRILGVEIELTGDQKEGDEEGGDSAEAIRAEISAVYGMEKGDISIRVKE